MSAKSPSSLFLVNFITGVSDGLLLPLAACILTLPFIEDGDNWKTLAAGILVSISGAIVFGLARFLGEKEEIHHHHPQIAAAEAEKEAALMQAIDIDPELSSAMQAQMEQEKELWLKEVRENELGWEDYDPVRARKSGMQTAAGFLSGGILIALLFFLLAASGQRLLPALLASLGIFYFFGWYKGTMLGRNAVRNGLFQLAMGMVIVLAALVIVEIIHINGRGVAFLFSQEA